MLPRTSPAPRLTDLGTFLAEVHPVVTLAQACQLASRSRLRTLVDRGIITRILPGVYGLTSSVHEPLTRSAAAAAWDQRCAVTGQAALHLYRRELAAPAVIDAVVPRGHHAHAPDWLRLHQVGVPRTSGAPHGVVCTTPERALLDAWRYARAGERDNLVWESLWGRVCTWRQLAREVERAPRVPDRRRLERMLGWFADGATSPLEVRAKYETFADARFRQFEWQVTLRAGTRRAVADMLHRRAMLIVELDGERYHARSVRDDRERDIELAAAGYMTVRFSWADVSRRPEWCRERLVAVVAARLRPVEALDAAAQ